MQAEEELEFLAETAHESGSEKKPWKLLIVDDDPGVHAVTKLALANLRFEGRGLEFISAFSSIEARQIIPFHADAAVVLLDVVMESDVAGLELARFIREELQNSAVRIILRTGQPGQIPETKVVLEYDINDYKTKTELTSQRLYTTVITALRGFRDIREIHSTKKGLEQVVHATTKLLGNADAESFCKEVLTQLALLLHLERSTHYTPASGFVAMKTGNDYLVRAATEDQNLANGQPIEGALSDDLKKIVASALENKTHTLQAPWLVLTINPPHAPGCLAVMALERSLEAWEKSVIGIFAANITALCANLTCRVVTQGE